MLEINNLTNFKIDRKSFTQVAKKVLSGENRGTESISVAFVDKPEIQKLNKKFRQKDTPTDVLSFNLNEEGYLGEVVICPEMVKEKGEEILEVFIHGILHLCGYDHEKSQKDAEVMESLEDKYNELE